MLYMYIVPITLYMYLHQSLQLEEAEAEVRHAGLEEVSQFVVVHQMYKHTECIFLWHFL